MLDLLDGLLLGLFDFSGVVRTKAIGISDKLFSGGYSGSWSRAAGISSGDDEGKDGGQLDLHVD